MIKSSKSPLHDLPYYRILKLPETYRQMESASQHAVSTAAANQLISTINITCPKFNDIISAKKG
jgi:hypothetical protein